MEPTIEAGSITSFDKNIQSDIKFNVNEGVEVMRLTKDGMIYKGVLIEDAGEAHAAFLETMRLMQNAIKIGMQK